MSAAPLRVLTWMPPEATARVAHEFDGVELVTLPAEGPLPEHAEGEVLLVGARNVPTLEAALRRGVRWIHIYGTGVDGFPLDLIEDGQTVTARASCSAATARSSTSTRCWRRRRS